MINKTIFAILSLSLILINSVAQLSFAADVETVGDLKVQGMIHSTSGGFKFPDGTTLTTADLNGLVFNVGFVVDDSASNTGNFLSGAIKFGGSSSGEGIASQRTSGTGQNGLDFYTNNTSRIFIRDNGNVGIGTRTPAEQLQITGNLRLPPTTASTGIIKSGGNTLLHTFGGDENFFAGVNAGNTTMTSGGGNTGVGQSVLEANVSGLADTGVGTRALWKNTTGSSNTALGYATLYSNTSGGSNTALGFGALYSNLTGYNNTAVGFRSLYASTGQGNTAVGQDSLFYNTGNNNVACGASALRDSTGTGNTAFGYYAGQTFTTENANTTGTYNTFIGFNAGPGTTTQLTNATAIGSQAKVNTSDSLVLGGTGVSAVKVGIGTASPTAALDVVGNVKISGILTPGSLSSASIGSAAVADSAITTPKIANSAVTASKLNIDGDFRMNDKNIYLRGDTNHGLGWHGTGKEFAGQNLNGPALFGDTGGALGTTSGGQKIALQWDSSGTVKAGPGMTGTPLAYGVVKSDGTCPAKSANVTCSGSGGSYQILITGEDFDVERYVTVVTVSNSANPLFASVSSIGLSPNRWMGITLRNLSSVLTANLFSFVTYKP